MLAWAANENGLPITDELELAHHNPKALARKPSHGPITRTIFEPNV
jgi:hypothetical protein